MKPRACNVTHCDTMYLASFFATWRRAKRCTQHVQCWFNCLCASLSLAPHPKKISKHAPPRNQKVFAPQRNLAVIVLYHTAHARALVFWREALPFSPRSHSHRESISSSSSSNSPVSDITCREVPKSGPICVNRSNGSCYTLPCFAAPQYLLERFALRLWQLNCRFAASSAPKLQNIFH